jgi:hypothetical protein
MPLFPLHLTSLPPSLVRHLVLNNIVTRALSSNYFLDKVKSFFGSKDAKEPTEDKDEAVTGSDKSTEMNDDATNNETAKPSNETTANTEAKEGANPPQDQTKKAEKVSLKVEWISKGVAPLSLEQRKFASAR